MTDDRLAVPRVSVRVPARRDILRFAVRGLLVWAALRTGLAIALRFAVAAAVVPTVELHPVARLAAVTLVAAACAVDARRTRGYLFHANLGQHPAWPALVAAGVATVMELAWFGVRG